MTVNNNSLIFLATDCNGASPEELEQYDQWAYYLGGISQVTIGLIGLLGNSVAIPVLLSKSMSSVFNKMLVCLAAFDNMFLLCSLVEAVREHFGSVAGRWHEYAYAYFGYQLRSIAIISSIFTTVVLALERYLAITRPIEYHNTIKGSNPWRRVFGYVIPVVICSTLFNIPKFLEIKIVETLHFKNGINYTTVHLDPTDLRLNDNYIFWYNNLAKLAVTGLLPFFSLCFFNAKIYSALKRRRDNLGMHMTISNAKQLRDDKRQAAVLFSIVVIFLICSVPRITLNLHEVFTIKQYKLDMSRGCHTLPFWVLLSGTLSQLLMVINSSMNFFIYCFMSDMFRQVLACRAESIFTGFCAIKGRRGDAVGDVYLVEMRSGFLLKTREVTIDPDTFLK